MAKLGKKKMEVGERRPVVRGECDECDYKIFTLGLGWYRCDTCGCTYLNSLLMGYSPGDEVRAARAAKAGK